MVNVSTYTTVKDSGIDWIGDIPESWNVRTIYQLASQVKCKNSDLQENNLLSLSYGKIKRKDINAPEGLLPASFDGYNIIEAGDIVLRLTDLQNDHTSLRVGLSSERGIITSAYTTLRPLNVKFSKYLYYLLHAFDLKKGFYGMGSGVRQGLNYDEVKELRIVLPSNDTEQEVITTYLDNQCGQIDSVIEETKASIEEYKTWKASIIYEAVTKGLDPTAEMKDSGVQWIGEIPKNWALCRLKNCYSQRDGGSWGDDAKGTESDRICLRIADFDYAKMSFKKDNNYTIRNYDSGTIEKLLLKNGDILIEKSGGGEKTPVGRAVIFDCESPALFANFMERLRCTVNIEPKFMVYVLFAFYANQGVRNYIKQTTGIQNLNITAMLSSESIALPLFGEQQEIAGFLNDKCSVIDDIITEKQLLIIDLESYKKSLVYEAVTGKRKVL